MRNSLSYGILLIFVCFSVYLNSQNMSHIPAKADNENLIKYVTSPKMPHFPGGFEELMTYLKENIDYPQEAKENDIEGEVVVQFWIDNEGKVHDVDVVRGLTPSLNEEAKRLIYDMPQWIPAEEKNKRSKMMHILTINFKLDDVRIPIEDNMDFNNNNMLAN